MYVPLQLLFLVLGEFMPTIDKMEKAKEEWDYLECLGTDIGLELTETCVDNAFPSIIQLHFRNPFSSVLCFILSDALHRRPWL